MGFLLWLVSSWAKAGPRPQRILAKVEVWIQISEEDVCRQARAQAEWMGRETFEATLGSEGADASVREEGTPGSERDGCWGQRGMDGVIEGQTGSERDRHRGQRGMEAMGQRRGRP